MSTTALDTSASEKNESPKRKIASNDDEPDLLAMTDPKPGGLVFPDHIWMVDIPCVDQDIDLIQDLTLADYLVTEKLSIEVNADEDTEGAQKYEFPDREISYTEFLVRRRQDISPL